MPLLHQSIPRGRHTNARREPPAAWSISYSVLTVSSHCKAAAEVKNSEPTKKVPATACGPTTSRKTGNGATKKHSDPIANSTAIHHESRCGAHSTCSAPGRTRDRRDSCLRRHRREGTDTVAMSGSYPVRGSDVPACRSRLWDPAEHALGQHRTSGADTPSGMAPPPRRPLLFDNDMQRRHPGGQVIWAFSALHLDGRVKS